MPACCSSELYIASLMLNTCITNREIADGEITKCSAQTKTLSAKHHLCWLDANET